MQIPVAFQSVGLLALPNMFMTVVWYGHQGPDSQAMVDHGADQPADRSAEPLLTLR